MVLRDADVYGRRSDREEGETEHFHWVRGGTIGSSATGTIYLGMETASGTLMAVKQLRLPTRAATVAAIDILKGLEHEHITRVLRVSADHEKFSIFLEHVPGGSVADLLEKYGPFEEPLAKTFVRQVLRALAYLHTQGIVHGTIRGTHVLVGNEGSVKLCGFGQARHVGSGEFACFASPVALPDLAHQLLPPPLGTTCSGQHPRPS
jgi:serine/threonine protein kinase